MTFPASSGKRPLSSRAKERAAPAWDEYSISSLLDALLVLLHVMISFSQSSIAHVPRVGPRGLSTAVLFRTPLSFRDVGGSANEANHDGPGGWM